MGFKAEMGYETLPTYPRTMDRKTAHHGHFVCGRDMPGGSEYPAGPGEGYRGGVVGFGSDFMKKTPFCVRYRGKKRRFKQWGSGCDSCRNHGRGSLEARSSDGLKFNVRWKLARPGLF